MADETGVSGELVTVLLLEMAESEPHRLFRIKRILDGMHPERMPPRKRRDVEAARKFVAELITAGPPPEDH